MAIYYITELEYSIDGTTYTSIPFTNGSATLEQKKSTDEQGDIFTTSIEWSDQNASEYAQRQTLSRILQFATQIVVTCTSDVRILLSVGELLPDIAWDYTVGDAPGSFFGFDWSYTLATAEPLELSFL